MYLVYFTRYTRYVLTYLVYIYTWYRTCSVVVVVVVLWVLQTRVYSGKHFNISPSFLRRPYCCRLLIDRRLCSSHFQGKGRSGTKKCGSHGDHQPVNTINTYCCNTGSHIIILCSNVYRYRWQQLFWFFTSFFVLLSFMNNLESKLGGVF